MHLFMGSRLETRESAAETEVLSFRTDYCILYRAPTTTLYIHDTV